jgi:alpha-tubulin suppressor-like RCC1 family protein
MGISNHSIFLLEDGTVRTVGSNYFGQCGTGSTNNPQLSLYKIPDLYNIKQVACGCGDDYTVFLLEDGTVRTVGSNEYGQCGTGKTSNTQLSLYTIPNLNNVKQVACGDNHTVFLLEDGTVRTVGSNEYGQCGTGNTSTPQLSLYTIPNLNNVKQVACGYYHTVFLLEDGTVRTVGGNYFGQCGTGSTTHPQLSLYTIPDLNNVKQVACGGYHTVFLLEDGTVRTVGDNNYGQCGTGNTNTPQLSLYTIPNLNNVEQVACGYYHTVFLLEDGTVRTVGSNYYGQCGTGNTNTPQLSLYTIPNLNNVKQVACGGHHSIFLLEDGTVKTVGSNYFGQCGTGKTSSEQLSLYTIPNLNNVKHVACGYSHTVFLLKDGTVRTVGYNGHGQCGTGSTNTPQLSLYTIPDLNNVKQVACGVHHTVFLLEDGTVKTVGSNYFGQCGTGKTSSKQLSLYTIPNLNNVKQVACGVHHTVFLLEDGTVRTVGLNRHGQCGTGNTNTPRLSLYTIPNLNNVKQVACGVHHTVFLLKDGTVRTVGRNDYGQCGTGNTASPQLSLYTIPDLTNVKRVACGGYHTVFLLEDGTVRTVGDNYFGQCGTGKTSNTQLSLYKIPNLNNVKQIVCGRYYTVFLLEDGTVRTVGYNGDGQCGTGKTNTPQLSLYTIPNLNNVKQIACGSYYTVFLLNDGTIRTVEYNEYGQCGTGKTSSEQLSLYTIPNLNNVRSSWDDIMVVK